MHNIEEIIRLVITNHPKDCIFHPNVVQNVIAIVVAIDPQTTEDLMDVLEAAITSNEIYCPHEGIDRRKEFDIGRVDIF